MKMYFAITAVICSLLFGLSGCSTDVTTSAQPEINQTITLSVDMSQDSLFKTNADSACVKLSSSNCKDIVKVLTITSTGLTGIIDDVPSGKIWTIDISVFDKSKQLTYTGNGNAEIFSGKVTVATIKIRKTSGTLIINGVLESIVDVDTTGLLVYYPFNGNANDASKHGYDGVVYGPELTTDRYGVAASAYFFDGLHDSIICKNTEKLNFDTSDFTIAFWVKTTANDLPVMSKVPTSVDGQSGSPYENGWQIHSEMHAIYNDGIRFDMYDGRIGGYGILNSTKATDNKWHFVSIVANRKSNIVMYVDGNGVDTASISTFGSIGNTAPLRLGVRGNWSSVNSLLGCLDDIRIYKRALSSCEISSLFHEGDY
jgi:hypothetical protein